MLTSFFSNSKPIQYFLLSAVFVMGYILAIRFGSLGSQELVPFWDQMIIAGLGVFLLLLFDFIIRKNAITKSNTYALFLFTFGLLVVINGATTLLTVVSLVFVLLAIRRIISLKTSKNEEKKILDASLYISIAGYFEFWLLLLFIVLYVAIAQKNESNWRYYFIPPVGLFAFSVLYAVYFLLTKQADAPFNIWEYTLDFNIQSFWDHKVILVSTILLLPFLGALGYRLITLNTLQKKNKKTASLLLVYALISLGIVLLSTTTTKAFIFIIPAFAMLVANAIETGNVTRGISFWVKEIFLWIWVVTPFIVWIV